MTIFIDSSLDAVFVVSTLRRLRPLRLLDNDSSRKMFHSKNGRSKLCASNMLDRTGENLNHLGLTSWESVRYSLSRPSSDTLYWFSPTPTPPFNRLPTKAPATSANARTPQIVPMPMAAIFPLFREPLVASGLGGEAVGGIRGGGSKKSGLNCEIASLWEKILSDTRKVLPALFASTK